MTAITPRIRAADVDLTHYAHPVVEALFAQLAVEKNPTERQMIVDRLTTYVSRGTKFDNVRINEGLIREGFAPLGPATPADPSKRPYASLSENDRHDLDRFVQFTTRASGELTRASPTRSANVREVMRLISDATGGSMNAEEFATSLSMLARA